MELYKYVNEERIDILTKGLIRFTQPLAWNDPFELQPFYIDHKDKNPWFMMVKWAKMYKNYQDNGQIPPESEIQEYEDERKRITKDDIYSFINRRIVGLSLTEDKHNLLMWSHYAAEHTGFVIEFDPNSSFFRNTDSYLFKVKCDNKRPSVNTGEFAVLIVQLAECLEKNEKIPQELYSRISEIFIKSHDWNYEKEWRIISSVNQATNYNDFKENLNTIYFGDNKIENQFVALYQLPVSSIKAIYCGNRMKRKVMRKLFLLINHNSIFSHIKLMKAELDNEFFNLNFTEIGPIDVFTPAELDYEQNVKNSKLKYIIDPFYRSFEREKSKYSKIKPAGNSKIPASRGLQLR